MLNSPPKYISLSSDWSMFFFDLQLRQHARIGFWKHSPILLEKTLTNMRVMIGTPTSKNQYLSMSANSPFRKNCYPNGRMLLIDCMKAMCWKLAFTIIINIPILIHRAKKSLVILESTSVVQVLNFWNPDRALRIKRRMVLITETAIDTATDIPRRRTIFCTQVVHSLYLSKDYIVLIIGQLAHQQSRAKP